MNSPGRDGLAQLEGAVSDLLRVHVPEVLELPVDDEQVQQPFVNRRERRLRAGSVTGSRSVSRSFDAPRPAGPGSHRDIHPILAETRRRDRDQLHPRRADICLQRTIECPGASDTRTRPAHQGPERSRHRYCRSGRSATLRSASTASRHAPAETRPRPCICAGECDVVEHLRYSASTRAPLRELPSSGSIWIPWPSEPPSRRLYAVATPLSC